MYQDDNEEWRDPSDEPPAEFVVLDKWFESGMYERIARDATLGCRDSKELIKKIDLFLDSAQFHLKRDDKQRIDYELKQLTALVQDFIQ